MNYLKADIGNTSNWSEVWSGRFQGAIFRPGVFTPSDGLILPVTLSSPLLVVGCFCDPAVVKPTWSYAGTIQAVANLNLFGGSSLSRSVFSTHSGLINRSRMVAIPRIVNDYQVYFRPAKWIESMDVTFYEYVGAYSDELIDEIQRVQVTEAQQNVALQDIQLTQADILSRL